MSVDDNPKAQPVSSAEPQSSIPRRLTIDEFGPLRYLWWQRGIKFTIGVSERQRVFRGYTISRELQAVLKNNPKTAQLTRTFLRMDIVATCVQLVAMSSLAFVALVMLPILPLRQLCPPSIKVIMVMTALMSIGAFVLLQRDLYKLLMKIIRIYNDPSV